MHHYGISPKLISMLEAGLPYYFSFPYVYTIICILKCTNLVALACGPLQASGKCSHCWARHHRMVMTNHSVGVRRGLYNVTWFVQSLSWTHNASRTQQSNVFWSQWRRSKCWWETSGNLQFADVIALIKNTLERAHYLLQKVNEESTRYG